MISGFGREMTQWITEHPLKTSKDLDEMQKFIESHMHLIRQEDAQSYLPTLTGRITKIQDDHPLIKEIENIQNSLLFP